MTTVIYQDKQLEVQGSSTAGELWLSLADLERVGGWELKEEGICKESICIQMPADESRLLRTTSGSEQFNLAAFAKEIEQPAVYDGATDTWYFGPPSWEWRSRLTSVIAPDFELPDWNGKLHRLSEWKGRKIFLLAWATW